MYSIPEDTPTPYHGKNLDKVSKIPTLMQKLLEAADLCQSVFPSMFPKVNENDFNATLKELVDNGCIEIVETKYGKHLRILTKGIDLCKTLDTEPKAKTAFCNVLGTVFKTFIPVVLEYVFSNPEWWNSIVQHFS